MRMEEASSRCHHLPQTPLRSKALRSANWVLDDRHVFRQSAGTLRDLRGLKQSTRDTWGWAWTMTISNEINHQQWEDMGLLSSIIIKNKDFCEDLHHQRISKGAMVWKSWSLHHNNVLCWFNPSLQIAFAGRHC